MAGGKTPVFLNKIAGQLREQNWFALAAELVIVVVGVFLGLQAANWNEERLDRKDEQAQYTTALHQEQNQYATLQGEHEHLKEVAQSLRKDLKELQEKAADRRDIKKRGMMGEEELHKTLIELILHSMHSV